MKARTLGASLVDLLLAGAIAALPAHVLALEWGSGPLPANGFPARLAHGPSPVTRMLVFLAMTAAVFFVLRWTLEHGDQGPGKCLLSLRVEGGKVVEDRDRLEPLERLGVVAARFRIPLLLGLASVLVVGLWGGSMERSALETRDRQLLRRAYAYDAEFGCCSSLQERYDCPRMLEVWAAIADHSDGKGDVPPRDSLLERCPAARRHSGR